MKQNLLINEYVKKHMLALIAVMMQVDPELDNYEYLDQKPDTGYIAFLSAKVILQKQLARIGGKNSYS